MSAASRATEGERVVASTRAFAGVVAAPDEPSTVMPAARSARARRPAAKVVGLVCASALVALRRPRSKPIGVRGPFGIGRSSLPAVPYGQPLPNSGSLHRTRSNRWPPLSV